MRETTPIRVTSKALSVLQRMKRESRDKGEFASYSKIIETLGAKAIKEESATAANYEELELIRKLLAAVRKNNRNRKLKRRLISEYLDMPSIRD